MSNFKAEFNVGFDKGVKVGRCIENIMRWFKTSFFKAGFKRGFSAGFDAGFEKGIEEGRRMK